MSVSKSTEMTKWHVWHVMLHRY